MNVALRSIELFAGGGGLALGLDRCGVRPVCFVEREAYAAAVLASHMEDGSLAAAPVWSDVCTFDGRPWRGVVDLVAGGFPCQDLSSAGHGEGIGGERSSLWAQFARIAGEVRPALVFIENVPTLARKGLDVVLRDLASLGFDAEWCVLPACAAGAPHARQRMFVLAHANGVDGEARLGAWGGPFPDDGTRQVLDEWGADPERAEGYFALRLGSRSGRDRVADGMAPRMDRLRLAGNGVVPGQAALAFRLLWRSLVTTRDPSSLLSQGRR